MAEPVVPGLPGDNLLDQINRLFEPPGRGVEDVGEAHPYFKRPGKGHNHDCCDSCSEGGALICCDLCPASFHLQCHDPPLSDSEIPEGDWSCIRCFSATPDCQKLVAETRRKGEAVPARKAKPAEKLARSPEKGSKSPEKVDSEWRPGTKKAVEVGRPGRATRTASRKTQYADHSTEDEEEEEVKAVPPAAADLGPVFSHSGKTYKQLYVEHLSRKPAALPGNPFSTLLAAAAAGQQVAEFQLPLELGAASNSFPYSWKWSSEGRRQRRGAEGEEVEARGRAKLCYTCVRSSRLGPLVSCDFCPCAFHMDCLDPPLAVVPTDVWMCPNHVENWLDGHLLSSTSASERVELWDRWARQPVDSHAVKLQFLRRCQRAANPHFSRRARVRARRRAKVPGYVKALYRQPTAKVPGPRVEGCLEGRALQEQGWLAGLRALQGAKVKDEEDVVKENILENGIVKLEDENEVTDSNSTSPPESTPVPQTTPAPHPALAALLTEYLATTAGTPVHQLDPAVVQYLAHRHLQTLLPPAPHPAAVRARASLTPLVGHRAPALMQYRSLAVGAGEPQGLDLLQHGACRHLSRKHATIFYDELSGQYELLNYSAHGSRVDNVLYALDLQAIDTRFPVAKAASPVARMAARAGPGAGACHCDPGVAAGCEGSALLRHGALVQFGCIQFVFSLAGEEDGNCAEL